MSHNNTLSVLQPATGSPPTPTPQAHHSSQRVSKAILKTAIQKANSAVVLDKANDLTGAIDAYTEAVNLLDRVLSSETREADRQRLQETHKKYMKRIQYLTTLKSDADDLYETFENGEKTVNDASRTAKSFQSITPKQYQQQPHSKGRSDVWVRKMNSSSSLDKRSNRLEMEMALSKTTTTARSQQPSSTAVPTPTSPSSINAPPVDVPLSPVSSKSTPSRPSSNRKSNDTSMAVDPPPPLEPRSIHRPSPRKSSRTGAAAALQQGPIEPIPPVPPAEQNHHHHQSSSQQRRPSMSSLSSMSSSDSDVIRVSSSHQPTMALPSLLHSKMEATSIPTTVTTSNQLTTTTTTSTISSPSPPPSSQGEGVLDNSNRRSNGSNRHSNDSSNSDPIPRPGSHPSVSTTPSMVSLMSAQDDPTQQQQQSGTGGFGRLRTSSLPRKLHFTRPVIGSSTRMHRMASNASSLDMNDASPPLSSSSSSISSGVPMRRNVTQPSTPVTPSIDPDTVSTRTISAPAPPQRQSSGLSMRKKYNRLSRTSMDGVVLGSGNSTGRKDKSGPIFSTLFGNSNSPYSPNSNGRSTEEALNYFGKERGDDAHPTDSAGMGAAATDGDGITSMAPAANQQGGTMNRYLDVHLKLIIALEHSMNYGGYITPKLFIPKNLWHQSYIRISSLDVKVAACESLILDLNRIEKWRNLDDIRGSLRLIESLEEVVDGLQVTLSKKLKQDSIVDMNDDTSSVMEVPSNQQQQPAGSNGSSSSGNSSSNNTGSSSNSGTSSISSNGSINKRAQFMSWGSKLSKSVERMNNFSLSKVEDQHRHYIEVLQKLFIKLHMLEMWFQHYLKKDRQKNPHYDTLLTKLGKVCDGINRVVGGFVLRDVAILLGKWLKRGGVWVNE